MQTRTRHPLSEDHDGSRTFMITSGAVSALLLHHHRRVTPRHAATHDFAGALAPRSRRLIVVASHQCQLGNLRRDVVESPGS